MTGLKAKELFEKFKSHDEWFSSHGRRGERLDISRENFSGQNLSGVYFPRAKCYYTDLSNSDLSNSDLSGAYLFGADLFDADLTDASIDGANFDNATISVKTIMTSIHPDVQWWSERGAYIVDGADREEVRPERVGEGKTMRMTRRQLREMIDDVGRDLSVVSLRDADTDKFVEVSARDRDGIKTIRFGSAFTLTLTDDELFGFVEWLEHDVLGAGSDDDDRESGGFEVPDDDDDVRHSFDAEIYRELEGQF